MSLGFILAICALLVGSFFFLYAMKYYITLAFVLWFSRRASRGYYATNGSGNGYPNGNGHSNGNGNGYSNGNGINGNGQGYRRYIGNGNGNGPNGFNGNGNGGIKVYNSKYLGDYEDSDNGGDRITPRSGLIVDDPGNRGKGDPQREAFFYRLFGEGLKRSGNGENGSGHDQNGFNGNGYPNGNGINGNGQGYRRHIANGNGQINGNGNGYPNGNGNGLGLIPDHEDVEFEKQPFVSIHLPFYNEKKVVNRILTACTNLNYKNYEIVVADDSDDETVDILKKWEKHPKIKVSHRPTREGWKGAALQYALERSDPRTEFVIIFDADFIPYPDTIWQFLKYFNVGVSVSGNGKNGNGHPNGIGNRYQNGNGNGYPNGNGYKNGFNGLNGNGYSNGNGLNGNGNTIEGGDYRDSNVAAVQGYQWHVLNKNENWITRGVRTEFAGSYVVERPGTEVLGSMKLIAGSVYMIRADVLRKYGWGKSITEDFELTLRLYADGYKVIYSPYIQTPSECVSTIKRLVRQRMRWAEGHTHNVRKMFWKIMRSPHLNKREKLEYLYLCPYYLQAAFFLFGTMCWFISDAILRTPLPFWTSLWGWCLVLTNLFALPLMNSVGLFLEESPRRDYLGIFSFVLLSYIVVPFQAYAAIKGLFEKEEGHWFRTPKSGIITDVFSRFKFSRLFDALFPGRRKREAAYKATEAEVDYLKPTTANNKFNSFGIRKRKMRWLPRTLLIVLLTIAVNLFIFARDVPEALASNWTNLYIHEDNAVCSGQDSMTTSVGSSSQEITIGAGNPGPFYWYSGILPTGNGDSSITAGNWTFHWEGIFTPGGGGAKIWIDVEPSLVDDSTCNGAPDQLGLTNYQFTASGPHNITIAVGARTITAANQKRIRLRIQYTSTNKAGTTMSLRYDNSVASNYDSNLQPATLTVPEYAIILLAIVPFLPFLVRKLQARRVRAKRR